MIKGDMSEKAKELNTIKLNDIKSATNEVNDINTMETIIVDIDDIDEKKVQDEKIDFKDIDIPAGASKEIVKKSRSIRERRVSAKEKKVEETLLNEEVMKTFHEGKNFKAQDFLGAHLVKENGLSGVRFTTWAPNAKYVYVTGDFNDFKVDGKYMLERVSENGIWSIFVPRIEEGTRYKYVIETSYRKFIYKSDPYALESELRPGSASIIHKPQKVKWDDSSWMTKRKRKNYYNSPMNIYEVHLGSWRTKGGGFLSFDDLVDMLPQYVEKMGYTHVEIMPLVEHPLDESWGYQGTGYFSVTSRYGNMEGFKRLVNEFHKRNIGVILDWVPGHFCRDEHGLYMFDGTPTYEYQEGWRANNNGWGTSNFDLGRAEVKSFLISNALFWINEFHLDGLRVDAVSNILYRDYGRQDGEWTPNIYGDHGNLEGIEFLRLLNKVVKKECNNVVMIAEESTAWQNVCKEEGLGFDFKWNMGWMNDVLEYVQIDTLFREQHHGKLNFSMMYAYSENFILPISHDEVVHGKKALVEKMFGDDWNKFAGTRLFLSYMMGHPGKKLSFMGTELGQRIEWRDYEQLEWELVDKYPEHNGLQEYIKDINNLYKNNKAMWELDCSPEGFKWIDPDDNKNSILSFVRQGKKPDDILIFICNFKSEVHYDFKYGVPYAKTYVELLNSDAKKYGGSGEIMGTEAKLVAQDGKYNNFDYYINIKVPPMGTVILTIDKGRKK